VRVRGSEAARAGLAAVLAAGAVLLALGGPARGGEDRSGRAGAAASAAPQGATAAGRVLFVRMGCGSCHRLAQGAGIGPIGPDLDEVLPNYDAAMLRAKIVDPYPAGASESYAQMPQDYGARMSAGELDELVAFLLSTARD
jgi:mono/diheme cytochrome c family protein